MTATNDPQQRLLDSAGQVFAQKGFEGATVREICRRAQLNLAAVNYYFRDKERLYIESVKAACCSGPDLLALADWPPGTPPTAKLADFIKTFVTGMRNDGDALWHRELFLRELAQPTAACQELVQERIRPTAQILGGILAELLPDVPELKRRLMAFSIVGQCIFYRVATPIVKQLVGEEAYRSYDAKLLADHITQFTLRGLGVAQTTEAPGPVGSAQ
jgi:AcrR family transcriptional regulator